MLTIITLRPHTILRSRPRLPVCSRTSSTMPHTAPSTPMKSSTPTITIPVDQVLV